MKLKLKDAKLLSTKILLSKGFTSEEAKYCTESFLESELVGKSSHGLIRLSKLLKMIDDGRATVSKEKISVVNETKVSLLINGKSKTGFYVVPKTFDLAINKLKKEKLGIIAAGCTNTSPAAGMIGYYAKKATEQDLIYIGFHNSMSYLVPFGAKKKLWGTNPVTIGIPSNDIPVIWDCSSSKISIGDILIVRQEGKDLPKDVALTEEGNPTVDPQEALIGAVLPFSAQKGSGMAFIVELLAGALTGSSITEEKQWNWASFFILIDPNIIRPIEDFKKDVDKSIIALKNLPKTDGVNEIYFPGEKSQLKRKHNLKKGYIDINDNLYTELKKLLDNP